MAQNYRRKQEHIVLNQLNKRLASNDVYRNGDRAPLETNVHQTALSLRKNPLVLPLTCGWMIPRNGHDTVSTKKCCPPQESKPDFQIVQAVFKPLYL
jgi:hypothetical protein